MITFIITFIISFFIGILLGSFICILLIPVLNLFKTKNKFPFISDRDKYVIVNNALDNFLNDYSIQITNTKWYNSNGICYFLKQELGKYYNNNIWFYTSDINLIFKNLKDISKKNNGDINEIYYWGKNNFKDRFNTLEDLKSYYLKKILN